MIAYDNKVYYNKSKEVFDDPEWVKAENSNEEQVYYWMIKNDGSKYIKRYKPSIAKLVEQRTGYELVQI